MSQSQYNHGCCNVKKQNDLDKLLFFLLICIHKETYIVVMQTTILIQL